MKKEKSLEISHTLNQRLQICRHCFVFQRIPILVLFALGYLTSVLCIIHEKCITVCNVLKFPTLWSELQCLVYSIDRTCCTVFIHGFIEGLHRCTAISSDLQCHSYVSML